MKNVILATALSLFVITACEKSDNQATVNKIEQQKLQVQKQQILLEKQKLELEKEKIAYETKKKEESLAKE